MKSCICLILSFWQICMVAATPMHDTPLPETDSAKVFSLITSLKNNVSQKNTDSLIAILNQIQYASFFDIVTQVVDSLFKNPNTARLPVISLSKIKCSMLDLNLALYCGREISFDKPVDDKLLTAIKLSGGNISYDLLMRKLCSAPTASNTKVIASKLQLWKTFFQRDRKLTFVNCISYFSQSPAGIQEMDSSVQVGSMIGDFIDDIATTPTLLIEMLPVLQHFVMSVDSGFVHDPEIVYFGFTDIYKKYPSLFLGRSTSTRHVVNNKIFQTAIRFQTPFSQAIIAEFIRCDDAVLRNAAMHYNYYKLKRMQSIPLSFNPTQDSLINAVVFGNRSNIKYDYTNVYLFPPQHNEVRKLRVYNDEDGFTVKDTAFTDINLIKVTNLYRKFLAQTTLELTSRYAINSLKFMDTTEKMIKAIPTFFNIETNWTHNFIDFPTLYNKLKSLVSEGYQKDGWDKNVSDSSAAAVVTKEFQRKALLAFALAWSRPKISSMLQKIDFSNIDSSFNAIADKHPEFLAVNSKIVNALKSIPSQFPSSPKIIRSYKVTDRQFSFDQGLYCEQVSYIDQNGKNQNFKWYGVIPVILIIHLLHCPHLLDFTNYSLSLAEFIQVSGQDHLENQNIENILSSPVESCNYLFSALAGPSTSNLDLLEMLVLNPYRHQPDYDISKLALVDPKTIIPFVGDTTFIRNAWASLLKRDPHHLSIATEQGIADKLPPLVAMFYGTYICKDSADYARKKTVYSQPYFQVMYIKTARRYNQIGLAYDVENLPDDKPCKDGDILCYANIGRTHNKNKDVQLDWFNRTISEQLNYEALLNPWDLTDFTVDNNCQVYLRQFLISPDYHSFFATYEIRKAAVVKYVNLEGNMPVLSEALKVLINAYPNFLSAYNLDLAGAVNNSEHNLQIAFYRYFNYRYGPNPVIKLFKEAGLSGTGFLAPGFNPKGNLFKTPEAKALAAEITFGNTLLSYARLDTLSQIAQPSLAFIKTVNKIGIESNTFCQSQAQDNFNQWLAAANAHKSGFTISFGYTTNTSNGSGGSISFEFSTGSVSFKFSTSTDFNTFGLELWPKRYTPIPLSFNFNMTPNNPNFNGSGQQTISYNASMTINNNFLRDAPTTIYASTGNLNDEQKMLAGHAPTSPLQNPVFNWPNLLPFVGPGPWENSIQSKDDVSFYIHSILLAENQFTEEELSKILTALKSGFVPEPMERVIMDKVRKAIEDDNIAKGEWVKTTVAPGEILPKQVNRHGLSPDKYIKDFNKTQEELFKKNVASKQAQFNYKKIFDDGMPGLSITYDHNFSYMMWTYQYKCQDGSLIEKNFINEVFPTLRGMIQRDPDGHVLEKLTTLIAEQAAENTGELSNPTRWIDYQEVTEAHRYKEAFKKLYDDNVQSLKEYLEPEVKHYFEALKRWLADNAAATGGIETPFVPDPKAAPLLNLFVPPWEWAQRRMEPVQQVLTTQRNSSLYRGVQQNNIRINP